MRFAPTRFAPIRFAPLRFAKGEVCPGEVRLAEGRPGEVRLYRGVPLPPGVPGPYALLLKDIELRLVCHMGFLPQGVAFISTIHLIPGKRNIRY